MKTTQKEAEALMARFLMLLFFLTMLEASR